MDKRPEGKQIDIIATSMLIVIDVNVIPDIQKRKFHQFCRNPSISHLTHHALKPLYVKYKNFKKHVITCFHGDCIEYHIKIR